MLLAAQLPDLPKLPGIKVYRIEIQQGNYITQEMVAQLKNGMTREQVRYVLGTPLVTDIFHADRWDYVFTASARAASSSGASSRFSTRRTPRASPATSCRRAKALPHPRPRLLLHRACTRSGARACR